MLGIYRLVSLAIAGWVVTQVEGWGFTFAPTDLRNAVNVIAGVDATLLGFLVSAGALLYAVANTQLTRNLQRTGHFTKLVVDLFIDSSAFLAALLVAMACLFLPEKAPDFVSLTTGVRALIFLNILSFLWLIPVGWKMWVLLTNLQPDNAGTLE